jgi:hypothetical protein
MNDEPITFEAGVRAFRELTAAGGDAAATRARVLAAAGARARRRAALRRLAPLVAAAAIAAFSSAAAAWVVAARPWLAAAAALVAGDATDGPVARTRAGATRVIPPMTAALPDSLPAARGEENLYGRAHRAHFVDDAPRRALAAWDAYLAAYPHGVFAPEARYNRALCLLRLGRRADAARALRPFADGRFGGYRRADAQVLLGWLAGRAD